MHKNITGKYEGDVERKERLYIFMEKELAQHAF